MAGTLSSTIHAATKEMVIDRMYVGMKEDWSLVDYFNFDGGGDVEVNDRGARWSTVLEPNPSGGAFSQAGALATAGAQGIVAASCGFTEYSMGTAVSGTALRQMNSPLAIERGLGPLLKRDKMTMLNTIDQFLFGDGRGVIGIVASVVATGAGGSVTLYTTVAGGSTYGARLALKRERCNFINPATGLKRSTGGEVATITSITDSTATVVFDQVPTDPVAVGDLLVRENTYNAAPRGLDYAISSNSLTIFGVSRATYSEWNSNVVDLGGAELDFSGARRMQHTLEARSTMGIGKQIDFWCGSPMFQALEEIYHPIVRINNDTRQGKIGIDEFEIGQVTVRKAHWCQDDRIWATKRDTFLKGFLQEPSLWEVDGKVWFPEPQVSATGSAGTGTYKDNMLMWHVFRGDLICLSPRDNGVTKNAALPTKLIRPFSVGR